MSMTKAIIFDMNGVLIDDEHIHELAFGKVLLNYGVKISHDDYQKICAGKTDRAGFEELAKTYKIPIDPDAAILEKGKYYLSLFPSQKRTFLGAIELVRALSQKYVLALTSSAVKDEVELILQTFKIRELFKTIVSAEDVEHGKPDPEPYLLTARKLGLSPKDCVAIEDSPSGIHSAIASGMTCLAITTTHSKEELKQANQIFQSFAEIQTFLL